MPHLPPAFGRCDQCRYALKLIEKDSHGETIYECHRSHARAEHTSDGVWPRVLPWEGCALQRGGGGGPRIERPEDET